MAKGKETPTGRKEQQGRGGGDRGSTAARPTLTRDWGGPQVRDPALVSSRGKPRVYVLHFEIDVNVCAVRAETHIKAKIV